MLKTLTRRNRARPRLDYIRQITPRRLRTLSRTLTFLEGIVLQRCGGGHRVLRRLRLP